MSKTGNMTTLVVDGHIFSDPPFHAVKQTPRPEDPAECLAAHLEPLERRARVKIESVAAALEAPRFGGDESLDAQRCYVAAISLVAAQDVESIRSALALAAGALESMILDAERAEAVEASRRNRLRNAYDRAYEEREEARKKLQWQNSANVAQTHPLPPLPEMRDHVAHERAQKLRLLIEDIGAAWALAGRLRSGSGEKR